MLSMMISVFSESGCKKRFEIFFLCTSSFVYIFLFLIPAFFFVVSTADAQEYTPAYAPEGYMCRIQKDTCVSALNQTKVWLERTLVEYATSTLSDGSVIGDLDISATDFIGVNSCAVNRDRAGRSDIYCFPITDAEHGKWDAFQQLLSINPPRQGEIATDDTEEEELVRRQVLDTKVCFYGMGTAQIEDSCVSSAESKSFEASCVLDQDFQGPEGSIQFCHNRYDEARYGDGLECGSVFIARDEGGSAFDERQESRRALSLRECNQKMSEYVLLSGTQGCVFKYGNWGQEMITGDYAGGRGSRMCFDATGLRRKSDTEIADLRRAEEARQAQQRAEMLRKQREALDMSNQEANRRGKESGALVQCLGSDCGWVQLVELANRVIKTVIWFAALIMILMILRAGWLLITAQGNVSKAGEARSALTKSIVGFCVVLCAWLIVNAVMNTLAKDYLQENSEVVDLLDE